jgi:tetratricopeptide (TPR) repeat protein
LVIEMKARSRHLVKQLLSAIFCQCHSFKKVPFVLLINNHVENYAIALELLKKAEAYTDEGDRYRAVTYNNFACIFRRTKKLRSALSFLEKALEIEYNYLHFS